jgi:UDP-GlcNAc:undecaprenyl-phosphate GlcNAc-1-phosphate transferase
MRALRALNMLTPLLQSVLENSWAIGLALVFSLVLTPAVRSLAHRVGAVARPRTDRWHKRPTAMLGGVVIFLSVVAVYCLFLDLTRGSLAVIGASSCLFAMGLVDDFWKLKPYQKLVGQVLAAAAVVYFGLTLPWTPWPLVNVTLTVFWLVGITNAVNLLDNMDGLAAGVAAIASLFLAVCFVESGETAGVPLLLVFAAALIGFLVYNSNPASIFMGDCGSMFIGFFLASASLMTSSGGRSRSFLPVLAVPVLILLIPIFDITVVTLLRKLAGRPISQGGRDHTSHRLVALGMTERAAVWMLYTLATASGLLALSVQHLEVDVGLAAIVGFTLVLTLLGTYLGGVKVYDEEQLRRARDGRLVAFLFDLSHRRRIFEVLLDLVLMVLAYYLAHVLIYGTLGSSGGWPQLAQTLPVLIFVKMSVFLILGVYRGLWRYVSVDSLILYARAVTASSLLCAAPLMLHFEGLSPAVFVLDGLLLLLLLGGSRIAFRLFRSLLPVAGGQRVLRLLIYGAGDAGELLVRELLNNRLYHGLPVAFVDDDPLKRGRVIHGLRVYGGNGSLPSVLAEQRIDEVILSSARFSPQRVAQIVEQCTAAGVPVKRMLFQVEDLSHLRTSREAGLPISAPVGP